MPAPAAESPEQRLEFIRGALRARRAQFQAAWIQAERQHPVLAVYRSTKPPDASSLSDLGSDEATTRSVVRHLLPKLGHIYRTKAALLGSWGNLDPLQLAPAVELTKQRMFVAQGSTPDRVVHDMVVQAQDKGGDRDAFQELSPHGKISTLGSEEGEFVRLSYGSRVFRVKPSLIQYVPATRYQAGDTVVVNNNSRMATIETMQ